jgi:hypothetical protein
MGHSWLKGDSTGMKIAAMVLVGLAGALTSALAAEPLRAPMPPPPPPPMGAPYAHETPYQHEMPYGRGAPFPHDGPYPHVEGARHPDAPQRVRTCFNPAETREKIISRRLSEPFRLLRGAAGLVQGEALRAKLCRWNDDYVYEIALLRRDGHIIHVYLNAINGQSVGAFNER